MEDKMKIFTSFFKIIVIMFLMSIATIAQPEYDIAEQVRNILPLYYSDDITVNTEDDQTIILEGSVSTLYDKYKIFDIASTVHGIKTIKNQITIDTEMLPNNMIKTNILNEMKLVSAIKEPDRVKVSVNQGQVNLNGTVRFYREKKMIQTLISWQKGVRAIANNLEVLPPEKARNDENVEMVLNQILKYKFPTEKDVDFSVENGNVYIFGSAESNWAKRHIKESFMEVIGVRSIENDLDVNL
jgi:osmotically-inducible protein OsmY